MIRREQQEEANRLSLKRKRRKGGQGDKTYIGHEMRESSLEVMNKTRERRGEREKRKRVLTYGSYAEEMETWRSKEGGSRLIETIKTK